MELKEKTYRILNKYGIKAKKRFGQNFLIDKTIIDGIVDKSIISNNDIVIEIGPGIGNLTEELLKKAKTVIAFEIDKDMIAVLKDRFSDYSNLVVINEDILQVNIDEIVKKYSAKNDGVKVVANLPYYITTPIMFKLFKDAQFVKSMTIMVQKEVADRIIANPGNKDYGILTINTKYYGNSYKLFDVPNTSFIPMPGVTSSVIKIDINKQYKVKDEDIFFKLVKAAFAQRRKKIINSMESSNWIDISKSKLKDILYKNGVEDNVRAEELDVQKYIDMANDMFDEIEKQED